MIKPTNNLPWKEVLSKNKKKYEIRDNEDVLVVDNIFDLGDALYIEEACNNYSKAIELLKEIEKSLPSENYSKDKDLTYFYNNVIKLLKKDINQFIDEVE